MDYKKAIRQIIDNRKNALDRAYDVYQTLSLSDSKISELNREKRAYAVKGDNESYDRCEEQIKARIKELGLYAMVYPPYSCPLCKDSAFVGKKLCSCVKKLAIESEELTFNLHSFEESDPNTFGENAELYLKTQNNLLSLCNRFPYNKMKNVVLMGKPGTGKTFLASCVANAIMQRGFSVVFLTAFEAVERMLKYHTTFNESKSSYLAPLLDCDLLVIDDLGSESMFKNVTVEYFFHIVNERMLSGKTTLITSNLTINEIGVRYGERTASRLFDKKLCYAKEFNFADGRKMEIK